LTLRFFLRSRSSTQIYTLSLHDALPISRSPHEVEITFETEIAGVTLRGRMDAVYADPDGGWTVVDWKTGALPDEGAARARSVTPDRKSTRLNSSHLVISYAVFCLKKKIK